MKKGRIRIKYASEKMLGNVQGFSFGTGIMAPAFMTAWCYYIDGVLFDTGISLLQKEAVEMITPYAPEKIILTHHHEDHSGNALAISSRLDIPVFGHDYTIQKMEKAFSIKPYQHIFLGKTYPVKVLPLPEIIETENHRFIPIHTPGHSKDHTSFLEKDKGWLFSGDLFLGPKIKIFRKDERIADQIESLKKVMTCDFDTLYCCHNPQLSEGKKSIQKKLDFLEDFFGTVQDLYHKGMTEKEILKQLDPGTDKVVKFATGGNLSFGNMVRSALKTIAGKA